MTIDAPRRGKSLMSWQDSERKKSLLVPVSSTPEATEAVRVLGWYFNSQLRPLRGPAAPSRFGVTVPRACDQPARMWCGVEVGVGERGSDSPLDQWNVSALSTNLCIPDGVETAASAFLLSKALELPETSHRTVLVDALRGGSNYSTSAWKRLWTAARSEVFVGRMVRSLNRKSAVHRKQGSGGSGIQRYVFFEHAARVKAEQAMSRSSGR